MPKLIDLSGERFHRLTVVRRAKVNRLKPHWECVCDCGKNCIANGSDLKMGKHRSCGCLQIERVTTHGASSGGKTSHEYRCWQAMKARCSDPRRRGYQHYGGRGIVVCDRWMEFSAFLADIGDAPTTSHSIDRIDNNAGYSPENCRWATKTEQALNRRTNRKLEMNGKCQTVVEWARELGISEALVRGRLKLGWTSRDALTTPVNNCSGRSDISGMTFGWLEVVSYSHTADKRAFWLCRCRCGTTKFISGKELRTGRTKSCGCNRGKPGVPKPRRNG